MKDYSDPLRLDDLAEQYGLTFRRVGSTYQFDDFTAHGFNQALGFVEGYDRAAVKYRDTRPNVYRLEALAVREILADDSTDPRKWRTANGCIADWLRKRRKSPWCQRSSKPAALSRRKKTKPTTPAGISAKWAMWKCSTLTNMTQNYGGPSRKAEPMPVIGLPKSTGIKRLDAACVLPGIRR